MKNDYFVISIIMLILVIVLSNRIYCLKKRVEVLEGYHKELTLEDFMVSDVMDLGEIKVPIELTPPASAGSWER